MQKASGRLETIPQSASLTAPFTQGSLGWVHITQCTLSPNASLTCVWNRKNGKMDVELSGLRENGTQRARSDVVYSALQLGKIPEAQKFRNFRRNCHHAERKTGT